ncbi:hypothetical protein [Leptospirillum ferrooxidans]|uniref:hypothetical protein n=1 Tax=Leptospirillum ferrooxidans TaxID=180 RepID=UPI0002E1D5AD|nr:hypothetical protein [Leptospirillum ferrooxidans]
MSIKLFVPTLVLGMFLLSPLLASADETRFWVLWEEVINQNAILYPNPQNPTTHLPFAEAMAYAVFPSQKPCEDKRAEIARNSPVLAKGWPYFFICLPDRVRPFYFGR